MNQTALIYDEICWAIRINSKTFRVSATGCIRTVYNPFDGILIWNQTRNLTSIREPPRLEFGEDEFSINFNIKDSFSFRHQFNITDLHFLQFCRDTLRIRKVVSHGTVDDFYFHDFTFFIGWIADYSLINRSPYTVFQYPRLGPKHDHEGFLFLEFIHDPLLNQWIAIDPFQNPGAILDGYLGLNTLLDFSLNGKSRCSRLNLGDFSKFGYSTSLDYK